MSTRLLLSRSSGWQLTKIQYWPSSVPFLLPYSYQGDVLLKRNYGVDRVIRYGIILKRRPKSNNPKIKNVKTTKTNENLQYPVSQLAELYPAGLTKMVAQWLECTEERANKICSELPNLSQIHWQSTDSLVNFLKQNEVTPAMLQEEAWLLLSSLSTMRTRLKLLSKIGMTSATMPLLRLTIPKLKRLVEQWTVDVSANKFGSFKNRLDYLAHHLACTTKELAVKVGEQSASFIFTYDFERVSNVLALLLSKGIPPDQILTKLDIFQSKEDKLTNRLQRIESANVESVKIWMIQATENRFKSIMEKHQSISDILGPHKDVVSYLADRLNCSKEYIYCLAKRNKQILNTANLIKMRTAIDFYYKHGITSGEICASQGALFGSVAVMHQRMQKLSKIGCRPTSLGALYGSPTVFQVYFNAERKNAAKVEHKLESK